MEQTVTMLTEEEAPEVGPNDIVIHLVNPYKCGVCELEFLDKIVFKDHMFSHLEHIKHEHPSSQIVMGITLPPETPGGVTVTRDILQLGEDGSIKQVLQPANNINMNQVSPLRELEEAGVIKLEYPKLDVMSPKPTSAHRTKLVSNTGTKALQQPGESVGLIASGVMPIEGTVAVEGIIKEDENGQSEVTQIVDSKDGLISFAFKGPNDEMQHIQIIKPEGVREELLMELTNVQGRRRANRGSGGKNNECDICGKILSSSTNLLRHKMYHSAERPFRCDTCNKGFKDVSNLKKHTMIHKRIFPCHLCKKSFLRKSLLATHLMRHESRTAVVKTGNSMKEIVLRTFIDDDGTRVEEMSMAALSGQTFEYKHRITKADPSDIEMGVKREVDDEKSEQGLSDAETSTEHEMVPAAATSAEISTGQKKAIFTVTMGGLQVTSLEQSTSTDDAQGSAGSGNVDTDDIPDLKIPPVPEEFVKMYQCGHCSKRTVQRGNMMRHLIHHLKEKPFLCDECPKQFVDKGELVKHKKTHSKPYRCPQCNGAFAHNVQLMKHLQSECLGNLEQLNYTVMEDGKTYKCDICCIEMKRLGNMIKHVGTHSVGSRRSTWSRGAVLNQRNINILRPPHSNSKNKPNAPYYYDSVHRAFFCGFCSKSFSQKASVHQHVRMHSKERSYPCTHCDHWFPCVNTLKRHIQMHTKPFKCDKCSCAFSRKLFLDAHLKHHAETEKTEDNKDYAQLEDKSGYFCKHCDKKLNKKYRMMNHVKMHLNNRPFECSVCNKCFTGHYMLLKHMKMHTKPFVCKICGETFTRKFFLLMHKRNMHSTIKEVVEVDTEEEPTEEKSESEQSYLCSICGAPFARLVIKVNHEKKCGEESKVMIRLPGGKGYKCKICNKVATLKHNLMVHIRKHDKVIAADIDEKKDSQNEPVKEHEQSTSLQQTNLEEKSEKPPPEKRPRVSTPKRQVPPLLSTPKTLEKTANINKDTDVQSISRRPSRTQKVPSRFLE